MSKATTTAPAARATQDAMTLWNLALVYRSTDPRFDYFFFVGASLISGKECVSVPVIVGFYHELPDVRSFPFSCGVMVNPTSGEFWIPFRDGWQPHSRELNFALICNPPIFEVRRARA